MQFTNFKKALIDLQKEYRTQTPYTEKDNGLTISENDFNGLSAFEKRTIETVARMYRLISTRDKNVDYNLLVKAIEQIAENRSDAEKQYLIALFFPERVKHINVLFPFPVPTYPFIQKMTGKLSPNTDGNFLLQAVCPLLVDSTSAASTVYVNTHNDLNGIVQDTVSAHYVPVATARCLQGAFNAYILQCFKISVQYIGRSDIQSGIFGGAYFISTVDSLKPDTNASLFNYIDDSINSVKVDSSDGLNVIYYPLDMSYTHFMTINTDNVASHSMNTSIRLCIYGSALPNGNVSSSNGSPNCIAFNVHAIYNVIPSQAFNELLPVDFTIQPHDKFDLVKSAQFINSAKLSAFPTSKTGEIERLLELPYNLKTDAINTLKQSINQYGQNSKYRNILDVLKNYVGTDMPPSIKIDKRLLTNLLPDYSSKKEDEKETKKMEEDVE